MRSLFFKIFVWFWIASILVGGVQFLTAMWTSFPPLHDRFRMISDRLCTEVGREAVESLDRGGKPGLRQYLARLKETTDVQVFLFDANKPVIPEQKIPPEAAEMVTRHGRPEGMDFPHHPPEPFLIVKPILGTGGKPYVAVMEMIPPNPLGHLMSNPEILILRLGAVILMAGMVCYGLARYLTRPLRQLRLATRQLANGDLSVRVGTTIGKRRDEIGDLGVDFDFMAGQIEALMTGHRRLLRDISHELRSPLTRLNVALELARTRAGTEAAGALNRIELEVTRLNELIGQLLTLARLENNPEGNEKAQINLLTLIRQIAEDADFEAQSRNRQVRITETEEITMTGMPDLLRSAVENVVRNAVYYTAENTAVEISLRSEIDGENTFAVIRVRDHGQGVPQEDLGRIFQPFYRVADARDRHTGGVGLGLSITDRSVRLHGGRIVAANVSGGGLAVELYFPLEKNSTEGSINPPRG
jgi:signal transduction histidine kinase